MSNNKISINIDGLDKIQSKADSIIEKANDIKDRYELIEELNSELSRCCGIDKYLDTFGELKSKNVKRKENTNKRLTSKDTSNEYLKEIDASFNYTIK